MAIATIGSMAAMADRTRSETSAVRFWLLGIAALVFLMVIVGGATRMTGSGLSITEWKPIMGAVPPLSAADWQDAFAKYQAIPQYALLNKGMSLSAFKAIFWWEWGHRFLGRFISVAYAVPFTWFLARGSVVGALRGRLLLILVLGALQGAMGWYMVQSGLADRIDVSEYRLAAHLLLAALIFAALLWTAEDLVQRDNRRVRLATLSSGHKRLAAAVAALVFVQIGLGALVAGLKAGLSHNTWPLMDGHVVPSGLAAMTPWWRNVFENVATVQFDHRMMAYAVVALVVWHGATVIRHADDERVRASAGWLMLAVLAQIGIGIWTLLAHVPLQLGLAHQAGAFIVFALAIIHWHRVARG